MAHDWNSLFCPKMNTATTFSQSDKDSNEGLLVTSKITFLPRTTASISIFRCNVLVKGFGSSYCPYFNSFSRLLREMFPAWMASGTMMIGSFFF